MTNAFCQTGQELGSGWLTWKLKKKLRTKYIFFKESSIEISNFESNYLSFNHISQHFLEEAEEQITHKIWYNRLKKIQELLGYRQEGYQLNEFGYQYLL